MSRELKYCDIKGIYCERKDCNPGTFPYTGCKDYEPGPVGIRGFPPI